MADKKVWKDRLLPPHLHYLFEENKKADESVDTNRTVSHKPFHNVGDLRRTDLGFFNDDDLDTVDDSLPYELDTPLAPVEHVEFYEDDSPLYDEYEYLVEQEAELGIPDFESDAPTLQDGRILSTDISTGFDREKELELDILSLWKSLSPRHKEVVALICMWQSNPQIAKTLGIAFGTAKNHVEAILEKFQMPDRHALKFLFRDWDFESWWDIRMLSPTPLPRIKNYK